VAQLAKILKEECSLNESLFPAPEQHSKDIVGFLIIADPLIGTVFLFSLFVTFFPSKLVCIFIPLVRAGNYALALNDSFEPRIKSLDSSQALTLSGEDVVGLLDSKETEDRSMIFARSCFFFLLFFPVIHFSRCLFLLEYNIADFTLIFKRFRATYRAVSEHLQAQKPFYFPNILLTTSNCSVCFPCSLFHSHSVFFLVQRAILSLIMDSSWLKSIKSVRKRNFISSFYFCTRS
jgi:hypothetical protein